MTRSRCHGTSLIEALTAVALASVLTAIAVPNLRRMSLPWAVRTATRQLATDLTMARLRAIATNTRYRVNFDLANARYTLERETQPNVFVAAAAPQLLPSGVTLGTLSPGNPIFDTRGMLTATFSVPVQSTCTLTHTVTMNVLGQTTVS